MKLRKVLGCALALITALTMAACGNAKGNSSSSVDNTADRSSVSSQAAAQDPSVHNTGDMPIVKTALLGIYDMTDAPMVQDAINEIIGERYGIQCELIFISAGSWNQQSNLLLTGDGVDVMTYFGLPLSTYVNNGQCLPLNDYVANAGDKFKALFTDTQMSGCQINGVQYTIPNLRNYGNYFKIFFDVAKLEELGYKAEDISTLDDVEKVLYAAHEKYPDIYSIVPQSNATFVNGWKWDGLGDQNYIGVLENCGQDTTVKDIFECEDFVEFCTYTRRWFLDGLMMGDALSNQDNGANMVQNGAAFAFFNNCGDGKDPEGMVSSTIVSNWTESTNITALTFGINPLSTDPDAAWTFLEAMYTDDDVKTLLLDGIENVHYVMKEDGGCAYPEGVTTATSTYGNQVCTWTLPYCTGAPVIDILGDPDTFAKTVEFNNSCLMSKAVGFVLDTDAMGITDQYAACLNVKSKYYDGLMNGILDPETVLEQAHQEMVDAGIEDVIAAKQAQLNQLLGK